MDINLITAIFCLIAIAYIIYLEFKNPMKKRDIFIDIMISVILIMISIFEFYELDFNFKTAVTWIYLGLILLGIFYIVIVVLHNKKYLEKSKEETKENESSNDENPL